MTINFSNPVDIYQVPSTRGWFNVGSQNLLNWRKVVAKSRAGTGRGKLLTVTDSTGAGSGAGSGGTLNQNGAFAKGWVPQLAALMNGQGGMPNLVHQGFFMSQAISVAYPTYDPRVTMGANWSLNTAGFGGSMFKYTAGAANNLTFTPVAAFDTIVVDYMKISGNGTATINVDGGASLGTISFANASSVMSSSSFTVSKATHTINIVPNNDASFFVMGIRVYDSTVFGIDVIQAAINGATVQGFIGGASPWQSPLALQTLAPDLTIICLTINDSNNQPTDVPTYQTNMQTLITAAKASGDVLLMVGPPSNSSQATDGTLDRYIGANRTLALSNNCAMLDLKQRFGSYAAMNAQIPYFDALHLTSLGYQDVAWAAAQLLAAA